MDRVSESAVPGNGRSRRLAIETVRTALIVLAALLLTACQSREPRDPDEPESAPRVVAVGISTIASLVEPLLDSSTSLVVALPVGADPATWIPTERDLSRLSRVDLFVAAGLPFEDRLHALMRDAGIEPAVASASSDPFFWLGFDGARLIVRTVTTELILRQPERAPELLHRMNQVLTGIDQVEGDAEEVLDPLTGSTVYISRPVLGSLLDAYEIRQVSSPPGPRLGEEAPPTPRRIVIQPEALAPRGDAIPFSPWSGPWEATIRSALAAVGAGISP